MAFGWAAHERGGRPALRRARARGQRVRAARQPHRGTRLRPGPPPSFVRTCLRTVSETPRVGKRPDRVCPWLAPRLRRQGALQDAEPQGGQRAPLRLPAQAPRAWQQRHRGAAPPLHHVREALLARRLQLRPQAVQELATRRQAGAPPSRERESEGRGEGEGEGERGSHRRPPARCDMRVRP